MDCEQTLNFRLPGACWDLRISGEAVQVLTQHRQSRPGQNETVGQLFCPDLTGTSVTIAKASVLARSKSSRNSVTFDAAEAEAQRTDLFRDGLHCVGFWHTHPEPTPMPSLADARLAADHAQGARAVLTGLCFIIVGTGLTADNWYVAVHDGHRFHRAQRVDASAHAAD